MEEMTAECGLRGIRLALGESGELYSQGEDGWHPLAFNREYRGYYPACAFTAIAAADGQFWAAGTDEKGSPHLFTSISGSVWEERNLTDPDGNRLRGRPMALLFAQRERQMFLITDGPQAAVLPDCPKCLRIMNLPEEPVRAEMQEECLRILFRSGREYRMETGRLAQYRVSWTFAAERLREGAALADLRPAEDFEKGHMNGAENVPFYSLEDWLEKQEPDRQILFLCESGILSDSAAARARRMHFDYAWSMGGIRKNAHTI